MTDIRAHVNTDFARHGVAVTVVQRTGDNTARVLVPGDESSFDSWRELDPAQVFDGASYRFRDEVARALLDALLDHYRGGHDARELRKDFEQERARVDKMLDALIRNA